MARRMLKVAAMRMLLTLLLLLHLLQLRRGVEDLLEGIQDRDAVREDAIGQEERVEKVDGQEAKIRQALQEPLRSSVPDLRDL